MPAPVPGWEPRCALDDLGVTIDGRPLRCATIGGRGGLQLRVLNLGGIVWSLAVPDARGTLGEVALGYRDPAAYRDDPFYLGAIVGRFANRIADGTFLLDGARVQLSRNAGRHHLHGGFCGLNRVWWEMTLEERAEGRAVTLTHVSPDGTEGYPGTLAIRVTYLVTDSNEWIVSYHAATDAPTPVNLTQHVYLDLAGERSRTRGEHQAAEGTIGDHLLRVDAESYVPIDRDGIPIGELAPVRGTPFDLRAGAVLGDRLADPALVPTGGYDHTFMLCRQAAPAIRLRHPSSGRGLDVTTTAPAVHVYTGNQLRGVAGHGGVIHGAHTGMCLETGAVPDAPNHPHFPVSIVRPGVPFVSRTSFAFFSEDRTRA